MAHVLDKFPLAAFAKEAPLGRRSHDESRQDFKMWVR